MWSLHSMFLPIALLPSQDFAICNSTLPSTSPSAKGAISILSTKLFITLFSSIPFNKIGCGSKLMHLRALKPATNME